MSRAPLLRQTFVDLTRKQHSPIVVNFTQVHYIDSAGIATLVECLRFVRQYDGALRFCGASELVQDVFEIANLDGVFEFFESEADAVSG